MNKISSVFGQFQHAALPTGIMLLVMLMVIPVPSAILDIGFVANIMVSLAVLMVALNARRPLDFSAFPTVLLLATIFRLALNVASTRVVLVDGHTGPDAAGKVIEAFGHFMIAGDYVVGVFVFFVLMIINVIVISKGAGRISEVSARFTLDALPGKQMAIDADLNAGLITVDEARERRFEVTAEADFYGAMDGASKFVKGDAMAGILILVINIVGGLILGVVSHGLSMSAAAETYIILAIGDALVAQVPALLLSIAAASIVTRVSSPLDLTNQISSQFSNPNVWGPVATILTILAILPGMPLIAIAPAAALAWGIWYKCRQIAKRPKAEVLPAIETENRHHIDWDEVSDNQPIELAIGYSLIEMVDVRKNEPLMLRITGIRRQMSRELGFVIPAVRVLDDLSLPGNRYRIAIGGVTVGEGEVFPQEMLALDNGEVLAELDGRKVKDPTFGMDALWISASARPQAIASGYTVVDASTVICTHLNNIVQQHAWQLFGLDDAQALVDTLKKSYPQLAQNLTPKPFTLAELSHLCRGLLLERVPVREFRQIAEAMIASWEPDRPATMLLELVRQKICALIVQTISPMNMPLLALTFSPDLEKLLIDSVRANPDAQWPFEAALAKRVVQAVGEVSEPLMLAARSFAIITSPVCRPALARLLRAQMADVPVLSFLEIPENKKIEIMATVSGQVGEAALPAPENNL